MAQDDTDSLAASIRTAISLPIPISCVRDRFLLFDINAVTFLREHHQILGVFIGTIPQAPSQNIFHGLPLQLMPEEAFLLVEKGVGYVVDDVEAHSSFLTGLGREERSAVQRVLKKQGQLAADTAREKKLDRRKVGLQREQKRRKGQEDVEQNSEDPKVEESRRQSSRQEDQPQDTSLSLFSVEPGQSLEHTAATTAQDRFSKQLSSRFYITPTTSAPPLPARPPAHDPPILPVVPSSYPLFKFLHSKGYFMLPGLRFGCHYSVYPGDPLRFHSHFLAVGTGWEEEFDLMQLVGGGRLGTTVKKSYLIGAKDETVAAKEADDGGEDGGVRTFCVEWAAM